MNWKGMEISRKEEALSADFPLILATPFRGLSIEYFQHWITENEV
jgi:hypothetical protein